MLLDWVVWRLVKARLGVFVRKNKLVERCYLRHSSAFGPQDIFFSDFDLTFLVDSGSLSNFLKNRQHLFEVFGHDPILKRVRTDLIILPAGDQSDDLVSKHYHFRSIYPFETWRLPEGAQRSGIGIIRPIFPLDQAPECSLFLHLLPIIFSGRKMRRLEKAYLRRRIVKNAARVGVDIPIRRIVSEYSALLSEIEIWGSFYDRLDCPAHHENVVFEHDQGVDFKAFQSRWKAAPPCLKDDETIASIWVYPNWFNEGVPYLSVNFQPQVTESACRQALMALKELFSGISFSPLVGREGSMLGRINGLARFHLFEPWLFERFGLCLHGDPSLRVKIKMPSRVALNEKFRELMFFFFDYAMHQQNCYQYYKLPYIMDHLRVSGSILLKTNDLAKMYEGSFVPRNQFNAQIHIPPMCDFLRKQHSFSFFSS